MADPIADERFLRRALDLARQGVGLAAPNPCVGAVIVDLKGNIAGEGIYTYAGVRHAEILALEQAGQKARGGTLYINLEPHSHQGRTPPCTDALIAAGVRRVVACMADPNPKVSGTGFEKLRAAGIHVEAGRLEAEARRINETFARYIRGGIPLVTLKSAMTLDGQIAPPPSAVRLTPGTPAGGWITGEEARAHVHEQRHASDAILVGVGTILADDPLLTDRSGKPRRRPLVRVILDSQLRMPLDSRLVQGLGENANDVLIFCAASARKEKKKELERRGLQIEPVRTLSDERLDFHAVIHRLGELEITSLIIEGGSTINTGALASGIVDKVFLYYAPKIMADPNAVPFMRNALPVQPPLLKQAQFHRFGQDFAIEVYLRDPYKE